MANFQAYNDKVWTLPAITLVNPSTNQAAAIPSGTAFAISSGLPNSLGVGMATGGHPVLTPKVVQSLAIPVTVSSAGMTPATFLVDVLPDPNAPLVIVIDSTQTDAASVLQNVPTAPGP
jgi:hypothetical protein